MTARSAYPGPPKECGAECEECIICRGRKLCCRCDWNEGYHGCATWPRKRKEKDTNGTDGQ